MTSPSWRSVYKLNVPSLLIRKLAFRTMLSDITTEIPCLIQKQLFPVSSIVGKQTILRYPINNSLNDNFFIKAFINFCGVTYILIHSMWLFCLLNILTAVTTQTLMWSKVSFVKSTCLRKSSPSSISLFKLAYLTFPGSSKSMISHASLNIQHILDYVLGTKVKIVTSSRALSTLYYVPYMFNIPFLCPYGTLMILAFMCFLFHLANCKILQHLEVHMYVANYTELL